MLELERSRRAFDEARQWIPDGVSSPMRAFGQVGGDPPVAASARGCRLRDVDGNEYVDFLSAFGAVFLGHAHEEITAALGRQLERGLVYGLCTEDENRLARRIVASTPAVEQLRFVCSGSEAVMTALRIARAWTRRRLYVKFAGAYHGHADALLAQPGDVGAAAKGASRGVMEHEVLLCPYNDATALEALFAAHPEDIAAVVVEPVATNMGLVLPVPGFHHALRALCDRHGTLLVFDEVVTGFRFGLGGVSRLFGIDPDLSTFGKIIGGGAPMGAYGGKKRFMALVERGGPVFQSGTFAANPLSMAAGNAALDVLERPGFYEAMEARGRHLEHEVAVHFRELGIPYRFTRYGGLCGVAFRETGEGLRNHADVKSQRYEVFADVHRRLREAGFLVAPSLEEPIFLTAAHGEQELSSFAQALARSIAQARQSLA
jgi:glutamate-1-semialdehyde 2,1-aminomutase